MAGAAAASVTPAALVMEAAEGSHEMGSQLCLPAVPIPRSPLPSPSQLTEAHLPGDTMCSTSCSSHVLDLQAGHLLSSCQRCLETPCGAPSSLAH